MKKLLAVAAVAVLGVFGAQGADDPETELISNGDFEGGGGWGGADVSTFSRLRGKWSGNGGWCQKGSSTVGQLRNYNPYSGTAAGYLFGGSSNALVQSFKVPVDGLCTVKFFYKGGNGTTSLDYSAYLDAEDGESILLGTGKTPASWGGNFSSASYADQQLSAGFYDFRIDTSAGTSAKSMIVDLVSVKMTAWKNGIFVSGSPDRKGSVKPGYGFTPCSVGETVPFSATPVSGDANTVTCCTGYSIFDGEELVDSKPDHSVSITYPDDESYLSRRLVWNFVTSNNLDVASSDSSLGTVGGTPGFCAADESVTFTAAPVGAAVFFGWVGDVPEGADATAAELVVPADRPRKIRAKFVGSVLTWQGGATGDFASGANWGGNVPGSGDYVVIPAPASDTLTVTVSEALDIGGLRVGGGAGAGSVTLNFTTGLATNRVAGEVLLLSRGTLTHETGNYKLNLEIGGSMLVASDAGIDLQKKGATSGGGGYGGRAVGDSSGSGSGVDSCYGSIREPTDYGRGRGTGTGAAGGVLYLNVGETLVLSGPINAQSAAPTSGKLSNTGSGGSIFIRTGAFVGGGSVLADSLGNYTGANAGGRVAIYQSAAGSFDSFTGIISARGGYYDGASGAGTIYLQHAGDVDTQGTLIVDNAKQNYYEKSGVGKCTTDLTANVRDADLPFGRVIVRNGGYLRVMSGHVLKVTKGIDLQTGLIEISDGAGFEFIGQDDCEVLGGGQTFSALSCTVPGKKIIFGTDPCGLVKIADGGSLSLVGEVGNELALLPDDADYTWHITAGANVVSEVSAVKVKGSDASSGAAIQTTDSTDLGGNVNWTFPQPIVVGELITWTGESSEAWTDAANWDRGRAPVETDVVCVPSGCAHDPVITETCLVNALTNGTGVTLTLAGADLTVTNDLVSTGSILGTGTLFLAGDGTQTAALGGGAYSRIAVAKTGGSVAFGGGCTAGWFFCQTDNPLSLTFEAGCQFAFDRLTLDGFAGENDYRLTLGSSAAESAWSLKAGRYRIRGVTVSDSDARAGSEIVVGGFAANGGRNRNWDFATDAAYWTGAVDGDFHTAGNWSPAAVPSATTHVRLDPTAAPVDVTVTGSVALASLEVGSFAPACDSANIILRAPITITSDLTVLPNGKVTVDMAALEDRSARVSETNSVHVQGNLNLLSGGCVSHTANVSSEQYLINLAVDGDMLIEDGAFLTAQGCGFGSGRGPSPGGSSVVGGASHGGKGTSSRSCVGSERHPVASGSGGNGPGGGVIYLQVHGVLTNNGRITASGGDEPSSSGAGAGGSVWIEAGEIAGAGMISADYGRDRASAPQLLKSYSGGGRVAIYQTVATDWDAWAGDITATGYSGGTIYKADASGAKTLMTGASNGSGGGVVQFPMEDGEYSRTAFAGVSVIVSNRTCLVLTNGAWDQTNVRRTVRIGDLDLAGAGSTLNLYGNVLKIASKAHEDGAGWAAPYPGAVTFGEIGGVPGEIIWGLSGGLLIFVR